MEWAKVASDERKFFAFEFEEITYRSAEDSYLWRVSVGGCVVGVCGIAIIIMAAKIQCVPLEGVHLYQKRGFLRDFSFLNGDC